MTWILKGKEGFQMYQKMYTTLFNAITMALENLPTGDCCAAVRVRLEEAQREAENIFLDWEGPEEDVS